LIVKAFSSSFEREYIKCALHEKKLILETALKRPSFLLNTVHGMQDTKNNTKFMVRGQNTGKNHV